MKNKGFAALLIILIVVVIAVVVVLAFCIQRAAHSQTAVAQPTMKTFDIASDRQFADYKQLISDYAQKHRPHSANDFCVLGYVTADNLKNAAVIWQQGRQIIVWYGGDQSLDASQNIIHLDSDVVPTENDLHGSTYLVTKAWVQQVTATCKRTGTNFHVSGQ